MTYHMPFDECRCRGEYKPERGDYLSVACPRRQTCQRYVDLHHVGERTPVVSFLCEPICSNYNFYRPIVNDKVT